MTVFSSELDRLIDTLELAVAADTAKLTDALCAGRQGIVVALGSGGSAASAEYLAVCRNSLEAAPTLVRTPLEFTLGGEDLTSAQVWLFSARGENLDAIGAFRAAIARRAGAIHIVTATAHNQLASEASEFTNTQVHVTPVADSKDGFLATHSLAAAIVALLRASDRCLGTPMRKALDEAILEMAGARLASESRTRFAKELSSLAPSDTLLLLAVSTAE